MGYIWTGMTPWSEEYRYFMWINIQNLAIFTWNKQYMNSSGLRVQRTMCGYR